MTIVDVIFILVFTGIGYGMGRLRGQTLLRNANKLVDEYGAELDRMKRDIIELRDDYLRALEESDDTSDRSGE